MAGLVGNSAFIPQVWRLFKLKSAREISLPFNILFLVSTCLWLSYGIVLGLLSVIFWNLITMVFACTMLYAKLKYGR